MAYLNETLDPCAAFGWSGGPEFRTTIVELQSGQERRNAEWAQPRHRFTVPFQNIDRVAYASIKQLHLVCRGMLHAFKYRDQLDYAATNQTFGIGTGSLATYQLSKLSVIDGVTYSRNVYAIYGTPTITANGSPISHTLDQDRGLVTLNATNGAVLRWSGMFDVWVRFNNDWLPFSIDSAMAGIQANAINGQVELIEVRPPPEGDTSGP